MLFEIDLCSGGKAYINALDVVSIQQTRYDGRVAAFVQMRIGASFEVMDTASGLAARIDAFIKSRTTNR